MSLLGFGQPQTGVFQMAYVVEDIDASMRRWVEQLKVGPWFLIEHFTGERGSYRRRLLDRLLLRHRRDLTTLDDDRVLVARPTDRA